ncbi:MAG TPA: sigma-70 family RNA polymerase sigma factor [Acidimicrobiales bacterium]|nr:sigma-70 family RNA polymerase sigma factor [Acidimicrobiales bacterium]
MTTPDRRVDRTDDQDGAQIADMVLRARAGDRAAIGDIVERCTPMLRALARRYVTDHAEIDDVLQDVWLTFVQNLDRIREPAATRGWLVRVLTHTAWRAQSRARRSVPTEDVGDGAAHDDTEGAALRCVWRAELRARLTPALRALRPADRRLVVLLAGEGQPDYRTLSSLVNRPIGSLGPTRQRALARMRRHPSLADVGPAA